MAGYPQAYCTSRLGTRPTGDMKDTGALEGGWGLGGHANTNAELVSAARAQIAELGQNSPGTSPSSRTPGPA